MDILILSIFAIVVVLSFIEDYIPAWQKIIILITIGIALVCISVFKPMSTADANNYETYFYLYDDTIVEMSVEPSYRYLSRFYLSFGFGITAIFLTYALIAIPLKLALLWKLTPFVFTSMIVYVGIYYPLHDAVQIRCGAATAFLLLAMVPLEKRQYFKALALMIVAALFHYSSLAFLPIFLLGNIKVGKYWKWVLAAAIPICLLLYLAGFSAFSFIPSSMTEGKLDIYKDMSDLGLWGKNYVPYKNIIFVAEFTLLYLFIYFYDTIKEHCIYAPILIKVLALEMGYFIMFAEVEVLGNRLHELFGMFNVLAYTQCLYIIKPRYIVRIGLAVFSLIYYLIQMYNEVYFH